jgi:hypothetical protein
MGLLAYRDGVRGDLARSDLEKDAPYGRCARCPLLASVMVLCNMAGLTSSALSGRGRL